MEKAQRRSLGISVIWNTLGNIVYLMAQYVLQIVVTRMSGNYAAGLLSTAMTVTNITLSVANYGMRSFQISDLEHKYTDRTYLRSRWVTVAAAGVGTAAFAMAVSYSAQQRIAIQLYTASGMHSTSSIFTVPPPAACSCAALRAGGTSAKNTQPQFSRATSASAAFRLPPNSARPAAKPPMVSRPRRPNSRPTRSIRSSRCR